ncbi:MAG: hypothetical protein QW182_05235, partial [Thermosphaera sp.]
MANIFPLMILLLSLLIIGVGYGLWSDTLKANVFIQVAPSDLDIGSWKVFARFKCGYCIGYDQVYLSPGNDTLHVLIGNSRVQYLWVGLVIENNRALNSYLDNIEVWIVDSSGEYNITPITYLYEPVKTGVGNMPYWGRLTCNDLPVQGYLPGYPVLVKPGYKMVAWLFISLDSLELSNVEVRVKLVS